MTKFLFFLSYTQSNTTSMIKEEKCCVVRHRQEFLSIKNADSPKNKGNSLHLVGKHNLLRSAEAELTFTSFLANTYFSLFFTIVTS